MRRPPRERLDPYTQRLNWPIDGLIAPAGSHVYADGAGFEGTWPGLRFAGWSVVVVDVNGDVVSALFGVVTLDEAPYQVARDGEDVAILLLSRNSVCGGPSRSTWTAKAL